MNARILKIAEQLKSSYLDSFLKSDDVSIFLCGGSSPSDAAFRRKLGDAISATKSKYRYSVFYPEDLFVELILGHQRQDLLTLENLLAKSVSAVVVLPQSPGTFAELGAFANHPQLKNKLVVVMDSRYERSQSFIATGPVRHLRRETTSRIIYQSLEDKNLDNIVREVVNAARDVGSKHPPTIDLTNPIACYEYYLALIHTLDPVPRCAVVTLARLLQSDQKESSATAAETVINALINQGDALLTSGNLRVSGKGRQRLFSGSVTDKRYAHLQGVLSALRVSALNVTLRKNRKRIWERAA